jgi:hypothetical protein
MLLKKHIAAAALGAALLFGAADEASANLAQDVAELASKYVVQLQAQAASAPPAQQGPFFAQIGFWSFISAQLTVPGFNAPGDNILLLYKTFLDSVVVASPH